MRKRIWIIVTFAVLLAVTIVKAQTRPVPAPIVGNVNVGIANTSWASYARDTVLTESWSRVESITITQPVIVDSLRFYSSSTQDSTKLCIKGIDGVTFAIVTDTARVSGTDSVYVTTRTWSKIIAIFCDTASVGTLSFKMKKGTSTICTIPSGLIQTNAADHWFGASGGVLSQLSVFPEPFSPMVEYELRLYRHQGNAISFPEKGYSVLWRGQTGGLYTIRPQISKQIVAANKDTSIAFYLSAPGSYNLAVATTAVGTSNTAYYFQDSPNNSTFSDKQAIDSLSTTGLTTTPNLRYKTMTLGVAGGVWVKFIAWGKAAAGDTSTVSTFVTPQAWNTIPDPLMLAMDEFMPTYSYVALYARSHGKNGRIAAKLKGTISR